MNPALKYLYHKFIDSPNRWHPILAVYYLTYQCDFRCPYCSNGFSKPYHELPEDVLPFNEVSELFSRIRGTSDYLVITGGEPLKHPDFGRVIERVNDLKFTDVALNTNGFEVDRFMEEIARSVNTLIFSLDTLAEDKADAWFGRGAGVLKKIRANITHAARYPGRRYRIMISSVVTPGNIPDLYDVYDFTQTNGFTFAACPELRGVKPPAALQENEAYEAFFGFLISEKKKGRAIHGSPLYLEHMRNFTKFKCRPFTMLVVDPLGRVFYPCLEIGKSAANMLGAEDLHAVRRNSAAVFGPQPECDARCHSACALGFSLILEHPGSMLHEAYVTVKGAFHRNRSLTRIPVKGWEVQ